MKKYAIEHTNEDVRKLWILAKNGICSRKTVTDIFKNNVDGLIVFNSKYSYEKYLRLQYNARGLYES